MFLNENIFKNNTQIIFYDFFVYRTFYDFLYIEHMFYIQKIIKKILGVIFEYIFIQAQKKINYFFFFFGGGGSKL